jgi:hypothetical protein
MGGPRIPPRRELWLALGLMLALVIAVALVGWTALDARSPR